MELDRKGTQIIINLDREEDAVGLMAVLSGQHAIDKGILSHGQTIYDWFYQSVSKLAGNFQMEGSVKYQSAEVLNYSRPALKRLKKK